MGEAGRGRSGMDRRRFLTLGAAGVVAAAEPAPVRLLWQLFGPTAAAAAPAAFTRTLWRPDDQLLLRFEFVNLARSGNQLNVINAAAPALIRIVLPSQHTAEETIAPTAAPPSGALRHRAAADTRLVFLATPPVPLTTAFLLDLAAMVPNLDPRANPGGAATGAPSIDVTAIEIPEGLVLTPGSSGRFVAPSAPQTFGGVTEVWRARLGVDGGGGTVLEAPQATPTVRAVFESGGDDTFSRALTERNRQRIVDASSQYSDTVLYPNHEAIAVKRLWLSPLAGGALDVAGDWSGGTGPLVAWRHKALTGRDIKVKVVSRGFLAPFGHPASIVEVSEREFRTDAGGRVAAALVKATYLTVSEPTIDYPRSFQPNAARLLPLRAITMIEPPEVDVAKQQITWAGTRSIPTGKAWIVTDAATSQPIRLDIVGEDHAGNLIPFTMRAVFVSESEAYKVPGNTGAGIMDDLTEYFAHPDSRFLREAGLFDQLVSFAADPDSGGLATARNVSTLRFKLERPDDAVTEMQLEGARQPGFFPLLEKAFVRDATVDALSGTDSPAFPVTYNGSFKAHGFGPSNSGGAFLDLESPVTVAFGGPSAAVAAPEFSVSTFSLALGSGPVPPLPNTTWDPASILTDNATFFGNLLLKEVAKLVPVGPSLAGAEGLPKLKVELEPKPIPDRAVLTFTFKPELGSSGIFVVTDDFADYGIPALIGGKTKAGTTVVQVIPFDGSEPTTDLEVEIKNFAIAVPAENPIIALYYREMRYSDPSDGSRELYTRIDGAHFAGDVAWLEPIGNSVGDSPGATTGFFELTISEESIFAKLTLNVPDLSFGVVNVHAPKLIFDLLIPFSGGNPILGIGAGTRKDPIAVSVLGIGGSFWMRLELEASGTDPFRLLELELAAILEAEVGFVVGRAGVRLSIGAGLKIDPANEVSLRAFVSLAGVVEILGFEVLSAEAVAALTYKNADGKLVGTLRIVLGALFGSEISESVSVDFLVGGGAAAASPARARLAGPVPMLTATTGFGDRYSHPTWQSYCAAFAS